MNLLNWFHKKISRLPKLSSTASESPQSTRYVFEPIRITVVADYLKLVGMTVEVMTKGKGENPKGDCFRGRVKDLSDSGNHLILEDVYRETSYDSVNHYQQFSVPLIEIDLIQVIDRAATLSKNERLSVTVQEITEPPQSKILPVEKNQPTTTKNANKFTRHCRAFGKDVVIVGLSDQLPFCEETCTQNGICDNRTCLWSIANAMSAKARAETKTRTIPQEEWMANLLRVDFPFMVDYTETAWDPCSVPIASCKSGNSFHFMADKEGVEKLDCTMSRSLQKNCLRHTINSGELVFANLGIQGYDNDPRGLFQIPEVLAWVLACENQIPDLAAWISPTSILWFATAVFNASVGSLSRNEPGFPVEFYREWVKRHIAAASRVLKEHNASSELIQRVTNSMWHKSGWALHEGWGAWFRGVPYRKSLAEELWREHRPLTTFENVDYNKALLDRVRKQAMETGYGANNV